MGHALVAIQFSLLIWLVVIQVISWPLGRPGLLAWSIWVVAIIYGMAALWANRPGNFNIHPRPRESGQLVTHGIYAWVRHPMYGALLLAGSAMAIAAAPGWRLTAWGAWLALLVVLTAKSMLEERWLAERNPAYLAYAQRTRRFLPGRF